MMKVVYSTWFPFGNFKAMAFWPWVFVKGRFTEVDVRHETIHCYQQKEMLLLFFYIAYLLCWLKELVHCAFDKGRGQADLVYYRPRNFLHRVEHSIIFEREAYKMQDDEFYLSRRKLWAWLRF